MPPAGNRYGSTAEGLAHRIDSGSGDRAAETLRPVCRFTELGATPLRFGKATFTSGEVQLACVEKAAMTTSLGYRLKKFGRSNNF